MYQFYLDGVLLPVAPSELQVKISNQNETINLINQGEFTLLRKPGLSAVSFTALLPQVRYPFAAYPEGFHTADYYLTLLERLKAEKKTFPFVVARTWGNKTLMTSQFDGGKSTLMSLEDYTVKESVDLGADVEVDVTLKQYRPFATQKIAVAKKETGEIEVKEQPAARPAKEPAKTYTVKKGDSLWAICQKQLGNGNRYREIADLNGIKNPSLIYPGQVIRFV